MALNLQSWGKGRTSLEAAESATADAYPEAKWSVKRLGGNECFVSS